jgi:hypothetical protein
LAAALGAPRIHAILARPATFGIFNGIMATFFNEYFEVPEDALQEFGAFNVSLVNDLPLFIDPFLLFHSENDEYQQLHEEMIRYVRFLRDRSVEASVNDDLLKAWYCFPEIKQNWLGFSVIGNSGSGLGMKFARALHANLGRIFNDFGAERVTSGSHLEKVCLISSGVGRDNISDFTTNLVIDYLCRYTERFANAHISSKRISTVHIRKARFDYKTGAWRRASYHLPVANGDYVILTPRDVLTRDENWINRGDLIRDFEDIPLAIPDAELRGQVFHYFQQVLPRYDDREPSQQERADAVAVTLQEFPQLLDYFIKIKEENGDEASNVSEERVIATELMFIHQLRELQKVLCGSTPFYSMEGRTYGEAHARLAYLKDVIENKGGHRLFYHDGIPIEREKDLQILYRLVWFGTPSDVGTEANDGRGPVDFKISRGADDKTLVEMKLAKNSQLERNLEKQVPIYQAASDAKHGIKAIIFFTPAEKERAEGILDKLGLLGHQDIVLIDARDDNKPSGSKA